MTAATRASSSCRCSAASGTADQQLRLTTSYGRVVNDRWQRLALAIRCSELKWLRRFDVDLYPWAEPPRILTVGEAPDLN